MSNIAAQNEVASEVVTTVPQNIIVRLTGETATERKASAVGQANAAARQALSNEKGNVGKLARAGNAQEAFAKLAFEASHNDFRGVAVYFAALTGKDLTISGRAGFLALPDRFHDKVLELQGKADKGLKADGTPKPALALQLRCYNEAHALISAATKLHNERKEQAKLGN